MIAAEESIESMGETRHSTAQTQFGIEASNLLVELSPGPWRSIGGYLDDTDWPDRDPFVQLDCEILKEPNSGDVTYRRQRSRSDQDVARSKTSARIN